MTRAEHIQNLLDRDRIRRNKEKKLAARQAAKFAIPAAAPAEPPSVVRPQIGSGVPEYSCYRKKRYSSEDMARNVAARCEELRGTPLRVYHCQECHGYHLTHLP